MELNNLLSRYWWKKLFSRSFGTLNYLIGQKGPVWINVDNPWIQYHECPELKAVIDRRATMFSNMIIMVEDAATGKPIDDADLNKLLMNPNCLQGQNDFLVEYQTQKCVYGNQFIYRNKPTSFQSYPSSLKNVSPRYLKPVLTGKWFDQEKTDGIIERYDFIQQGFKRSFDTTEILYTKIADIDNPIIGLSPVNGLRKPITNIKLAYDYQNVILGEKGAIGMLSQEKSTDGEGAVPMAEEEKERIEKQMTTDYGVGESQKRVILTYASLKWTPMSYPTKELLLGETIDAGKRALMDQYGMNQNIFSSITGVTYENLKNGMVMCYQDTIQPEADKFLQALGPFIGLKEGLRLRASYEHIPVMKENKLKGMEALNNVVDSLTHAIQAGLISSKMAIQILANELGVKITKDDNPVLTALNSLAPKVGDSVLASLTEEETRALVELGPKTAGAKSIRELTPAATPIKQVP